MTTGNSFFWKKKFPIFRLRGSGSRRFLHGQTSADILSAEEGEILQTCWLKPSGRVRALLEIRLDSDGAEALVLGGSFDEVLEGFKKVIFPADQVSIENCCEINRFQLMIPPDQDYEKKVLWLLSDQSLPKEWKTYEQASSLQVEFWRMKVGLPFFDEEFRRSNNPFELGLGDWVSLDKGCYLGQEILSKLAISKRINKKLRFWESFDSLEAGVELFEHSSTSGSINRAGFITSVVHDDKSRASFGLALIRSRISMAEEFLYTEDSKRISLYVPSGFVGYPGSEKT